MMLPVFAANGVSGKIPRPLIYFDLLFGVLSCKNNSSEPQVLGLFSKDKQKGLRKNDSKNPAYGVCLVADHIILVIRMCRAQVGS
jgi:hypothetical protein